MNENDFWFLWTVADRGWLEAAVMYGFVAERYRNFANAAYLLEQLDCLVI